MSFEYPWELQKLKNVCVKIGSGATPKGGKESYAQSGIALIRSQNVYNNYFSYSGLAFINEDQAKKLDNVSLNEDDILLNITGDSVCRSTIVPKNLLPARVNQHVAIIRPDKSRLNPFFLKSFLVSRDMQTYMLSLAQSGGTRAALTKGMIEEFEIPLPKLKEQQAIVSMLKVLDDKIELNNAINKNLEEVAQALFKRWFIDFEFPNEKGEPYKSSGGEFVESELGLIPKGWKVNKLDSLCSINTSSINPLKNKEATFEHYSIPSFDAGAFPVFDKGRDIKSNKYKVINNSILLSKLNPQTKRLWVPLMLTENAVSSTEFINYIPKDSEIKGFLYSILDSEVFQNYICSNTTGSTNSRQRISPQQTLNFQFPCPNNSRLIYQFSDMINQIIKKMQTVLLENIKLSAIRDTLLPKLMSGEIRVPVDDQELTSINE